MFDTVIKIIGPGLVVNLPAAIIYDALTRAGYKVEIEEFDGQFRDETDQDRHRWPYSELVDLNRRAIGSTIKLDVDPQPWGS